MLYPHFDSFTLVLYVIIGILSAVLIKSANTHKSINLPFYRSGECIFYTLLIVVFVCFALFREVGVGIGGGDAIRYIEFFESSLSEEGKFEEQEQIFLFYNRFIRTISDNYKVFWLFSYTFIAFAYVYFIKNFIPGTLSYIPFLLLVFPYLKSFSSIRSSLAIALLLVGIVFLLHKKRELLGSIIICATFFIHRMSVIYVLFLPFYFVFRKLICKLNKKQLSLFVVLLMVIGYAVSLVLQKYVLAYQLVYSSTDAYYLTQSIGTSIWTRWPMMFQYILLFAAYLLLFQQKRTADSEKIEAVKILCVFDLVLMPASIVLGMWRANEYLYAARLIMWGVLIELLQQKVKLSSKGLVNIIVFVGFVSWLVFRICSEWEDLKIMPYVLDIF